MDGRTGEKNAVNWKEYSKITKASSTTRSQITKASCWITCKAQLETLQITGPIYLPKVQVHVNGSSNIKTYTIHQISSRDYYPDWGTYICSPTPQSKRGTLKTFQVPVAKCSARVASRMSRYRRLTPHIERINFKTTTFHMCD